MCRPRGRAAGCPAAAARPRRRRRPLAARYGGGDLGHPLSGQVVGDLLRRRSAGRLVSDSAARADGSRWIRSMSTTNTPGSPDDCGIDVRGMPRSQIISRSGRARAPGRDTRRRAGPADTGAGTGDDDIGIGEHGGRWSNGDASAATPNLRIFWAARAGHVCSRCGCVRSGAPDASPTAPSDRADETALASGHPSSLVSADSQRDGDHRRALGVDSGLGCTARRPTARAGPAVRVRRRCGSPSAAA